MARSWMALFSTLIAGALSGCNSGPPGEVKLGVDVAAIKTQDVQTGSADLTLDRLRVLMHVAKVGYTGGKESGGPAAEIGPQVIDLTADEIANGAHREFDLGTLESGTYGGAEIEIDRLSDGESPSGDDFADFLKSGASVIVDGTYKGAAYSFAGHFLAEQGTDGDVEIDAAKPVTLSLTVDASTWFKDASGAALDPSDSALHDSLAVAVCTTLDTQPQLAPGGGGDAPAGSSSGSQSAPPPDGDKLGGHDGGGHGGHGGGGAEHCVEAAP